MNDRALVGGGAEACEEATRRRQAHRTRARRFASRSGEFRGDRPLRRPPVHRLRDGSAESAGRRRGHRARPHRGPQSVRVRARLRGVRRQPQWGLRPEDLQGHGPRDQGRRAPHRAQRLGRCAHPGRGGVARRVRRHLPAQHARERRHPADLLHHGPLRGRSGLLAGHHRLHLDGRGHELHVHHGARRHQSGDARGGDEGRPGRRDDARDPQRRVALHVARRQDVSRASARASLVLAVEQPGRSSLQTDARPADAGGARARHDDPARGDAAVRREGRGACRGRRRVSLRGRRGVRAEHRRGVRARRGGPWAWSPTSRPFSPACSTSTRR